MRSTTTMIISILFALLGSQGCASTLPVAGEWVGGLRQRGQWHAARIELIQQGSAVRGVAEVPSLGIAGAAVQGAVAGARLRLRVDGPGREITHFEVVREPGRLHTDHRNVAGPALQLVPSVGSRAVMDVAGWYTDDSGVNVVIVPASEGGLRFFGVGRLSGKLLPSEADQYHVAWFDQAPTLLHTGARFVRDASGRVTRFEIGEDPGRQRTTFRRIEHPEHRLDSIEFHNGAVRLRGTLFAPADGRRHPAVVFVHGTGFQTADRGYEMSLLDAFLSRGVAVLLYDKRGCGGSTGDWRSSSLEDLARDAAGAVSALRSHPSVNPRRIGVYGISEGGWIAPITASLDPELAFIVNQGGPAVPPLEDEMDDLTAGVARLRLTAVDHAQALRLVRAWVDLYRSADAFPPYLAILDSARTQVWFKPFASRLPTSDADWEVQWWRKRGRLDPKPLWVGRTVPSLVLIGERDETMDVAKNLDRYRELSRTGPMLDLRVVAGADHSLRVRGRRAAGFPEDVADWVARVTK